MNSLRSKLIVLEKPKCPDAEPPICKWCGEEIEIVADAKWQTRQRAWHRGDKWEIGTRNCRREMKLALCWSARDALRWQAWRHGLEKGSKYRLFCVDCGEVVEGGRAKASVRAGFHRHHLVEYKKWHADHQVEIIDGGAHELSNFRCRCVECHKTKTLVESGRRRVEATQ